MCSQHPLELEREEKRATTLIANEEEAKQEGAMEVASEFLACNKSFSRCLTPVIDVVPEPHVEIGVLKNAGYEIIVFCDDLFCNI